MRLYDSLRRTTVDLIPRDDGHATLYCCGPTVYSPVHVGNARPYVLFAVLRRALERHGLRATWACNITDVNDKIYAQAAREGRASAEVAADYTLRYVADTDLLGFERPDVEPRATETIDEIVGLIEELVRVGAAYPSGGDVYFRVRSYPPYGELSGRRVEEMREHAAAARLEELDAVEAEERGRKEDPLDFALWKGHKAGEDTSWPSPWGAGRPGWHIECSAMAEAHLGLGFDVHGGGVDLKFPHHENEAAQTAAAHDRPLASIWMHNGMLRVPDGSDKMGKSEGNAFELRAAVEGHGLETVLLVLHNVHYRSPAEWSPAALEQAAGARRRLTEVLRLPAGAGGPDPAAYVEAFDAALDEDLNVPAALAACFGLAGELNRAGGGAAGRAALLEMLHVLGLAGLGVVAGEAPPDLVALAEARARARADRDFAEGDRLRDVIEERGWAVRDRPDGGFDLIAR